VRRAYSQAQPILADLLGSLEDGRRDRLAASISEVTSLISSGKFSAAWRYPELISAGQLLYDEQARDRVAAERERRALDTSRRKAADLLRDPGVTLPAEVATRLNRELRSAGDAAAVDEASARIREAVASARSAQERRREREIDRTRARITRSPRGRAAAHQGDSWQDVLLKLKHQLSEEETQEQAEP
jgi:hypothetical protein